MRNFDERIAEIYRRSEKIVQQRKKRRKHILLVCIPLVLCLTVLGALSMPSMMPKGDAAPENMAADASGIYTANVVKVDVTGENRTLTYTDVQDVLRITDYLRECTLEPPAAVQPENNGVCDREDSSQSVLEDQSTENTGYTVTLVMEDGSQIRYFLQDHQLINAQTNCSYPLSQGQLKELKAQLGLSLNENET